MSLRIRLSRGGAKKRPYYRIVVTDSRNARDGRFLERLGTYDPMLAKDSDKRVVLDAERIKHWIGKGALPSERVARFLANAGLGAKPAVPQQTKKNQPKPKTLERMREKEEKAKAAAEAAAAAAAAPVEEAQAEG